MSADRGGTRLAAGVAWAALAAAIVLTAWGGWRSAALAAPDQAQRHAHAARAHPATAFQREMDVGMARMMSDMHAPGYSGNADVDFLAMMIPHHAGAVDMARLLLQHGRDPATRMLAEEIIAGQTSEIQSMTRRLQTLRQGRANASPPEFPSLGGTRGP